MPVEYLTPKIEHRALELQSVLAERGQHRAIGAGSAHRGDCRAVELTVLHVDKEFELIAEITGQPVERLDTS